MNTHDFFFQWLRARVPGLSPVFVGIFERAGMRSRIRAIATHRRPHPLWGAAAALMIAAITLVGATRAQDASIDQKDKAGWGSFVSFKDGTLTLKGSAGELVWNNITGPIQVFHWDTAARDYKPASPAEALSKVEAGTWIFVAGNKAHIRVGAAKEGHVTGTFVSFKEDNMLMLGKDLPASNFTKKYGNQLNFPRFADNVPVFESIDGGEYTLAGAPSTTLPRLKEGTLVTVYYGPADGSFIRIEIGVRKAAAADNAGKTIAAPDTADQKEKSGYGKYLSFKDGTLTLKGNYSGLVWNNIPEQTPVVHWDDAAGEYKPSGTAEVLGKVEAGTWIIVGGNKALIRVGARKGHTTGTFVSFKNDRLLMLGKDLGERFTKKFLRELFGFSLPGLTRDHAVESHIALSPCHRFLIIMTVDGMLYTYSIAQKQFVDGAVLKVPSGGDIRLIEFKRPSEIIFTSPDGQIFFLTEPFDEDSTSIHFNRVVVGDDGRLSIEPHLGITFDGKEGYQDFKGIVRCFLPDLNNKDGSCDFILGYGQQRVEPFVRVITDFIPSTKDTSR